MSLFIYFLACLVGVLLVKLQGYNVYVATTDVQSNPDDTLPWKFQRNGKSRALEIRREQLQTIARLLRQVLHITLVRTVLSIVMWEVGSGMWDAYCVYCVMSDV